MSVGTSQGHCAPSRSPILPLSAWASLARSVSVFALSRALEYHTYVGGDRGGHSPLRGGPERLLSTSSSYPSLLAPRRSDGSDDPHRGCLPVYGCDSVRLCHPDGDPGKYVSGVPADPGPRSSSSSPYLPLLAALNYPALERPIKIKIEHLSSTLDPVVGVLQRSSPQIVPTLTYDAALAAGKQFDVIWVPAGPNPKGNGHEERGVDVLPPSLINFLRWQAPTAQYVMSVWQVLEALSLIDCLLMNILIFSQPYSGGSYILAHAGLLSAKRATSNKYIFTHVIVSRH